MNYDETNSYDISNKKHQIHVEISEEMHKELKNILPEKGMISLIVRQLVRIYLQNITQNNVNPMHIFKKGEL